MAKTEERAVPDLVKATRQASDVPEELRDTGEISIPSDWGALDAVEPERSGKISVPVRAGASKPDPAPPAKNERNARSTLTSPIPAMMAEQMRAESNPGIPIRRDPDAPEQQGPGESTRRIGASSDRHDTGAYTVEVVDDGNAERRQRAARLIDRARALMDSGDVPGAARAAEEALEESDQAAPPGIVEVIEPARPLLTRVFAAFVGPLSEVPVLARRSEEITALRLDPRKHAVLARVDGRSSLDQIFDGARIPATDALRIAAALLRAGVIRVV